MRLSMELIDDLIAEIAGEETIPLVHFIRDKKNVSEFKLADNLDLTVNQVRNLLYRLDEHNLVWFMRKKDKKKGWYEYYWTLNLVKARALIIDLKREKISQVRKRLQEEKEQPYYYCPNKCIRVSGEDALEYQFKCSACDEVLQQEDMESRKKEMNEELKKLRNDLQEAIEAVEIRRDAEAIKKKAAAKVAKKIAKEKEDKKKAAKKKVAKKKAAKKKVVKKKVAKKSKKPVKKATKKKVAKRKPKKKAAKKPTPKKKVVKKQVKKVAKKKVIKPTAKKTPPKKGFLKKVFRR